jgi:hypothetical protein
VRRYFSNTERTDLGLMDSQSLVQVQLLQLGAAKRGQVIVSHKQSPIMLNPQKTLERDALLRRHRELQAEIAQHERNLREREARLPIEEQLSLNLRRVIESEIPELAGKVRVKIGR